MSEAVQMPTLRRRQFRSLTAPRYRAVLIGALVAGAATVLAVIGPWITPYSPTNGIAGSQLLAPSTGHLFGTDAVGLDIFSRVLAAPRMDLTIALLATLLAAGIGTPIGAAAGYYRSFWSEVLMRMSDLIQSFPVFILAMVTVVVAGHNLQGIVFVVAIVNAPVFVRLVRAEVLSLRERTFVQAAEALGLPGWQVIARHLVPNALGPIVAQASITVGFAMLLTAGLSFIGAGVRVPTPEWGSMIAIGAPNIVTGEWWPSVFPGLALTFTVFGFALLGESLQNLADPIRQKK
jgi:peptide/nickel transport system permease protein